MATCNFTTQNNFPLFATKHFDGYYYEDEDTGEMEYFDENEGDFEQAQTLVSELNDKLKYFQLKLESGYYEGVQTLLEDKTDSYGCAFLTKYYSAADWKKGRAEEKAYYGYYDDFDMSYSDRKKAEQRELRKILNFCRTKLKDLYDFDEYVCTARFSNGETLYGLASNERNRIKAAAIA